eukprot:18389-Pelagococcus_subviridis.AAC.4
MRRRRVREETTRGDDARGVSSRTFRVEVRELLLEKRSRVPLRGRVRRGRRRHLLRDWGISASRRANGFRGHHRRGRARRRGLDVLLRRGLLLKRVPSPGSRRSRRHRESSTRRSPGRVASASRNGRARAFRGGWGNVSDRGRGRAPRLGGKVSLRSAARRGTRRGDRDARGGDIHHGADGRRAVLDAELGRARRVPASGAVPGRAGPRERGRARARSLAADDDERGRIERGGTGIGAPARPARARARARAPDRVHHDRYYHDVRRRREAEAAEARPMPRRAPARVARATADAREAREPSSEVERAALLLLGGRQGARETRGGAHC